MTLKTCLLKAGSFEKKKKIKTHEIGIGCADFDY